MLCGDTMQRSLTNQVRLWVFRLDAAPKGAPECVVNLPGHVQSPPVNALLDPVFRDAAQKVAYLGIGVIELGQRFEIPPGLVPRRAPIIIRMQGKRLHQEPVAVGRGRAVFEQMIEVIKAPTRVIEDAVEHETDTALVRRIA